MQSIIVRHNVEMGHRLSLQPDSKCFHLHGHSWWIDLEISGPVDEKGMILNFADVKGPWRSYLDNYYDHHMCLSRDDELVRLLGQMQELVEFGFIERWGITAVSFDPTVENMAAHWGYAARDMFGHQFDYYIKVQEAAVNAATWRSVAR